MSVMLYKFPGVHELHGGKYDYVIVEEDAVEASIADGWFLTTPEAKTAHEESLKAKELTIPADDAPPTREELEAKATELGLKFDKRTGEKKLAELIADKLKA